MVEEVFSAFKISCQYYWEFPSRSISDDLAGCGGSRAGSISPIDFAYREIREIAGVGADGSAGSAKFIGNGSLEGAAADYNEALARLAEPARLRSSKKARLDHLPARAGTISEFGPGLLGREVALETAGGMNAPARSSVPQFLPFACQAGTGSCILPQAPASMCQWSRQRLDVFGVTNGSK